LLAICVSSLRIRHSRGGASEMSIRGIVRPSRSDFRRTRPVAERRFRAWLRTSLLVTGGRRC
jgi:hypothetical protein